MIAGRSPAARVLGIIPARWDRRDLGPSGEASCTWDSLPPALAAAQASAAPETRVLPRSIHPYPNNVAWGEGTFCRRGKATLKVGGEADTSVVERMKDTWQRFTFGAVELAVSREAALKNAPDSHGRAFLIPAITGAGEES